MSDSFIMYRNPVEAAIWDSLTNGSSDGGASIFFTIMILAVTFILMVISYQQLIAKHLTPAQNKKLKKAEAIVYSLIFILAVFVTKVVKLALMLSLEFLFQILAFI